MGVVREEDAIKRCTDLEAPKGPWIPGKGTNKSKDDEQA